MTEIKDLLVRINTCPESMGQIDWQEETCWFDKERMKQIIMGIINDKVCNYAGEMIIESWYYTCNNICDIRLMEKDWDGDLSWRFFTAQDTPFSDGSIDCFIRDVGLLRKDSIMRKNRLKVVAEEVKKLQPPKPKIHFDEDGMPFEVGETFDDYVDSLETENTRLTTELDTCLKKITSLKNDYIELQEKYTKATSEWEEKTKVLSEDVEKTLEQAKVEAVRELVKQIVIYAEGFPANENAKADTIKGMLLAKAFYEHIPNKAFDEDLRKRIDALGRKEMSINMTAKSMFEVTGNQKVVIGNGQNG